MARKSILDFKWQNKLSDGAAEGVRGSGRGVVRLKAVLQRKNVARMDGRGTAPPSIYATFLVLVLPSIGLVFLGCSFGLDTNSSNLNLVFL